MNALGAALALSAALATYLAGRPAPPAAAEVLIRTFQFQPDTLVVAAGARVVWHNQDEIEHTVTAGTPERPGSWGDHALPQRGAAAGVTFRRPGTYPYHCGRHPSMRGTVRVIHKGD